MMLDPTLNIVLATIFFTLSLLHFNWILGGTWGLGSSLPTKNTGKLALKPRNIDTISVGLGLLLFAIYYTLPLTKFGNLLPVWMHLGLSWGIPIIFAIRTIGDFNYVGLFKKIKDTKFAKADNKLFIPLCVIISLMGFILA
jgi:hypothetical protein